MFKGIIVPLITPFNEDFSIDFNGLKWLVRYLINRNINGIFLISTTGEFVHLSFNEKISIVENVINITDSNTLIIAGASENSTLEVLKLSKEYVNIGVHGIVVTPPYYFKYNAEGLWKHFSTIAEKVEIPILLYNIPPLTGNNIEINLVIRLAKEYSNIVGIKVTYDSLSYLRRLIQNVKNIRKDFSVLTGSSEYLLPILILGGDGGVLALAHIAPRICVNIVNSWLNGNFREAYKYYMKLISLTRLYDITSSIPSMIKTALMLLKTPIKPIVRPPLMPESNENVNKISEILREFGSENLL